MTWQIPRKTCATANCGRSEGSLNCHVMTHVMSFHFNSSCVLALNAVRGDMESKKRFVQWSTGTCF